VCFKPKINGINCTFTPVHDSLPDEKLFEKLFNCFHHKKKGWGEKMQKLIFSFDSFLNIVCVVI
jgi:hypothetical protein